MKGIRLFASIAKPRKLRRLSLARIVLKSRKPRRFLVPALAARDRLKECAGVSNKKIEVVREGLNPNQFSPEIRGGGVRKRFSIPEGAPLIVQCGRIDRASGVEKLVEAFLRLSEDLPEAILLFAGDGETEKMGAFLKEEGLRKSVLLAGFQQDPAPFYAAADVVVSASRDNTAGSASLCEAMAMERPVVATSAGGNAEVVQDGMTGLVVPAGDSGALADAIAWALEHANEANAMARSGREWALANCAEGLRSEKVESIYYESFD
jgi:glycosyltransferase involved in cell wall biosynthesis